MGQGGTQLSGHGEPLGVNQGLAHLSFFRDVVHDLDGVATHTFGRLDQRDHWADPEGLSILAHVPFFHSKVAALAGDQFLEERIPLPNIVRVNELVDVHSLQFLGIVTQHLLQCRVAGHNPAIGIHQCDAHRGIFKNGTKASFTCPQRGCPFGHALLQGLRMLPDPLVEIGLVNGNGQLVGHFPGNLFLFGGQGLKAGRPRLSEPISFS